MNYTVIVIFLLLVGVSNAQEAKILSRATLVRIWDHRVSDIELHPIEIRDQKAISQMAAIIGGPSADWQQGSFSMPFGYLMIAFWKGDQVIARFGVGKQFLVRGNMEDWQIKHISKQNEQVLANYAENRPNKPLVHNDYRCHGSCGARPAPSVAVVHH